MLLRTLSVAAILFWVSAIRLHAFADSDNFRGPVFVLLQNGNVIQGRIGTQNDRISLLIDGNSIVSLDPKQVEHVGVSLESLYQHQRQSVRNLAVGEHIHLAHWCIQHGLLSHAIEHFQALEKSTAADSPQFKQLEHKLREALLKDLTATQTTQANQNDSNRNEVVRANSENPKLQTVGVLEDRAQADAWTNHEIPSYIRKTFQNSVLPVLVTRCGQSGCHGLLGKSDFHIYQPAGEQAATILARDLDEVLRYVDRERVQNSPLLAYATKAHGIKKNPVLNQSRDDERALIDRINQWIKSLAISQNLDTTMPAQYPVSQNSRQSTYDSSVTQAVANEPVARSGRQSRSSLRKIEQEQERDAKLSKPTKSAPPPVFLTGSEISEIEAIIERLEQKFDENDSDGASSIKDPFDPEQFNRKFR